MTNKTISQNVSDSFRVANAKTGVDQRIYDLVFKFLETSDLPIADPDDCRDIAAEVQELIETSIDSLVDKAAEAYRYNRENY